MGTDAGSYGLPDDPLLAEVAVAMRNDRSFGHVWDPDWNLVYLTAEIRRTCGGDLLAEFAIGAFAFAPESAGVAQSWRYGANSPELMRGQFALLGGHVLADTAGGRDELRERVDPLHHDMIDDLEPCFAALVAGEVGGTGLTAAVRVSSVIVRIRDDTGRLAGTATFAKPATGMDTISAMISNADLDHLVRMQLVTKTRVQEPPRAPR